MRKTRAEAGQKCSQSGLARKSLHKRYFAPGIHELGNAKVLVQVLRHPQPGLGGQMRQDGQMVLQCAGDGNSVLHRHPPGK